MNATVMQQTAPALNQSADGSNPPAAEQSRGHWARVLLLAIVLIGAVLAIHLTPIRAWLANAERLRATLNELGIWVYPTSVLAIGLLVACGVPRLLFCAICGAIFGFWIGLPIALLGTVIGHYAAFLFIRWGGRDWALQRWSKLRRWADLMHDQGVVGVILVRQIPAHAMLLNLCLGISRVKHRHYLIGTAIGLLPEAIPATLVGAGLVKRSLMDSAGYLAVAAAALALIWIGCGYALRAMRRNRADVQDLV